MTHTTLDKNLDFVPLPRHSLLEPPSPAYSNVTVRRAFIVWMYCGQRNSFQQVCNYYHYLEALEDKLPAEVRAMSRHHEFDLFSNQPPISKYLTETFPSLYSHSHVEPDHIKKLESIKNEKCIFKLEGFNKIPQQKGATTEEVVEASRIVRKYCNTQMIPLRKFLTEFKEYATRCQLNYTVNTVASYIKRKMLQAELDIINNYPKTFSFLDSTPVIFEEDENSLDCEILKPEANDSNSILDCEVLKFKGNDNNSFLDYEALKPKANSVNSIFGCESLKPEANNVNSIFAYEQLKPKVSNDSSILDYEILKSNASTPVFKERDVKLNDSCAAFFNSFNAKYSYFDNKSVSCSPLDSNKFQNVSNGLYNISHDKMKSRSVESLLCKNFNVKSQGFFNSSMINFDEFTKLRRI